MERRIKLTDDDLRIIADSLENTRDSAIDTKRDLTDPTELATHGEFIDRVAMLEAEFRDRIEEDE
jgi:hypothetical protein